MKERTIEVLINMGIPFNLLGLKYIAEAMELFDAGYHDIKIMALYKEIGKRNNTTASRVERGLRHAFSVIQEKGNSFIVKEYLSFEVSGNANLLKLLYYRLKKEGQGSSSNGSQEAKQIIDGNKNIDPYQILENDLILTMQSFVKNLREASTDACIKTDQRTLREFQGFQKL